MTTYFKAFSSNQANDWRLPTKSTQNKTKDHTWLAGWNIINKAELKSLLVKGEHSYHIKDVFLLKLIKFLKFYFIILDVTKKL